jgi:hypothetical protein
VTGDVFVVGPVRSGTSWLQTMLAEHPDLASPPETHLFANYLGPLDEAWQQDRSLVAAALDAPDAQVVHGLSTVVDDTEFVALLRGFYDAVRDPVVAAKAGATRLLEKTPDHAVCLDTITRVVPDAAIVFMVRDPRATVRSVLQASTEPWGDWAPKTVHDAAGLWRRSVRPVFRYRKDPRVVVVRYEDLCSDPEELARVAKFVGLAHPSTWLRTTPDVSPDARSSTVVRGAANEQPFHPYGARGFSFHDRTTRRELTRYESAYVVTRCRDEMRALGYDVETGPLPARLRAEQFVGAVRYKSRQIWRNRGGRAGSGDG